MRVDRPPRAGAAEIHGIDTPCRHAARSAGISRPSDRVGAHLQDRRRCQFVHVSLPQPPISRSRLVPPWMTSPYGMPPGVVDAPGQRVVAPEGQFTPLKRLSAAGTMFACSPYVCGATNCKTSCAIDADCAAGFTCTSGNCVVLGGPGAPCTTNAQCASNVCPGGQCQ